MVEPRNIRDRYLKLNQIVNCIMMILITLLSAAAIISLQALDEKHNAVFRAPVDDTQVASHIFSWYGYFRFVKKI